MTDTVEKFLNRILKNCEGKRYLFRGTTISHKGADKSLKGADKINSSLYRWAVKKEVKFDEKYNPFNIEKEILKKAKKHFADSASNIEVLTDLQHFQGKTNLIDFSHNLYVALFFACDGKHPKKDGELILLNSAKIGKEKQEIDYTELRSSSVPFPIEPASTQSSQKRVTSQSSVFVYPPSGYINRDLCEFEKVPADLKRSILDHLREIHNIHTDTIYNDLIGFIANEKNYETASVLFYQGFASDNKGKYKEAIGYYDKAIELNPNDAGAYNNRGGAKYELGQHRETIADYDKAIELNPSFAEAYNNRGLVKDKLEQYSEAIDDYNKAIELNPDFASAYNNRGTAKGNLGRHQETIADYNKSIELDPNNAKAYHNRGIAKCHLEQYLKAISDFEKAIELDPKYAKAYYNRGRAKYELAQYQEVIADCDKAIGLDPNYEDAYQLRGIAKRALGRTQEADEDFKMADKLESDEAS